MTEQPNDRHDRPDPKAAWSEAGERLSGLGSRLRQHYQQHAAPSAGPAEPSEATSAQVKDAANRLNQAVHTAFEAVASASKDPSVKDDARRAGRSVADALAGTFAGLSGELSKTFGDRSKATPAAPQPAAPQPAAEPVVTAQPDPDLPDYGSPEPASPAGSPPGVPDAGSPEAGPPATPETGSPVTDPPGTPEAGLPGSPESDRLA